MPPATVAYQATIGPFAPLDTATPAKRQVALTERLETQAEVYRSLMHITLTHSNMPYFIMQSWADADSWTILDPYGNGKTLAWPGIYDADYRPKPAYYALIEELGGSPLPGALFKTGPAQSPYLSGQSASLSWTPAWGATSYEYCYDTVNDGQCQGPWISTGAQTSSLVAGLTPGATYYWQVRAVKGANHRPADNGAWWSFTAFNNAVPTSTVPGIE